MSKPISHFNRQAQPYWDEAGNYFPPGFDPETGTWTDPAFSDAYERGYVWDAAVQNWVSADEQMQGNYSDNAGAFEADGMVAEPELDPDGPEAQAVFDAVYRMMDQEFPQTPKEKLAHASSDAAQEIQALLRSAARQKDEQTALTEAVTKRILQIVLPTLSKLAQATLDDWSDDEVLSPAQVPVVVPQGDSVEGEAPAPLMAYTSQTLRAQSEPKLTPIQWAMVSELNLEITDETRARLRLPEELPYRPTRNEDITEELTILGTDVMPLRLKNQHLLPDNFDGALETAIPQKAAPFDDSPISQAGLQRIMNILGKFNDDFLRMPIYVSLDDPRLESVLVGGHHVAPDGSLTKKTGVASGPYPFQRFGTERPVGPDRLSTPVGMDRFVSPAHRSNPGKQADEYSLPSVRLKKLHDSTEAIFGQNEIPTPPPHPRPASPVVSISSIPVVSSERNRDGANLPPVRTSVGSGAPRDAFIAPTNDSAYAKSGRRTFSAQDDHPTGDIELALSSACKRPASDLPPPPKKTTTGLFPIATPIQRQDSLPPPTRHNSDAYKAELSKLGLSSKYDSDIPAPTDRTVRQVALNGTFNVLCRMLNGKDQYNGRITNPVLTKATLPIEIYPSLKRIELETAQIQAIFFQRNALTELAQSGRKARLIFQRGTQRTGYIPRYDPNGVGFIFLPIESEKSRFGFWFVYSAAVASIDFMD